MNGFNCYAFVYAFTVFFLYEDFVYYDSSVGALTLPNRCLVDSLTSTLQFLSLLLSCGF